MADKVSIAKATDQAIVRLMEATNRISLALDMDAVAMPPKNRDHDYENMARLVALAQWAEAVANTFDEPAKPEGSTDGTTAKTKKR